MTARKKNLDVYLHEVFKQYIALKDDDTKKSQEIFKSVFDEVKQKMGQQCNYFNKYATQVMYAGSVYDGVKVGKLDEFDMDIVIRLPINYDDSENGIIIEDDQPGFVKLKITKPFDNLDKQKEWETCHKVTREWRDSDKYFLQSKFRQWLHGIVQKALNDMNKAVDVNGVKYIVSYKMSGPAYTLNIRNDDGDDEYSLDVDLVPVIRFMLPRWPPGCRNMEGSKIREWLVVPKPNRAIQDETLQNRCWRLSFQHHERELMKGCQQLKVALRLLKKLRDALGMKAIASYYIKTLFLWKVEETDEKYWQQNMSAIFREMVQKLHDAIEKKNIPYFWNKDNNLIESLKPTLQTMYCEKLRSVLKSIDANDVEKTVYALLTTNEKNEFKSSQFFKDNADLPSRQVSVTSVSEVDSPRLAEGYNGDNSLMNIIKSLLNKVDMLTVKVEMQNDRITQLEQELRRNDNTPKVEIKDDLITLLEQKQPCDDDTFKVEIKNVLVSQLQ